MTTTIPLIVVLLLSVSLGFFVRQLSFKFSKIKEKTIGGIFLKAFHCYSIPLIFCNHSACII